MISANIEIMLRGREDCLYFVIKILSLFANDFDTLVKLSFNFGKLRLLGVGGQVLSLCEFV